jgi:hypothetical protein
MDTDKVLLIVGLILLLFFIMRSNSYNTIYTTGTPVTKTTTVVYRTPQVNSVYVSPGHYNAYKAQFYN